MDSHSLFGTAGIRLDHPCVFLAAIVTLWTASKSKPGLGKNRGRSSALLNLRTAFVQSVKGALNSSADPHRATNGEDGLTWWQRVLPAREMYATDLDSSKDCLALMTSFAKHLREKPVVLPGFQSLTIAERDLLAAWLQHLR